MVFHSRHYNGAMPAGTLPQPLTTFFGREDEIRAAADALREYRLVTLAGPGGVGKTRVSIEVARVVAADYRDGAWFVDLSALRDGARVPNAITEALGASDGPHDATASLAALLFDQYLLLVIDNCEQVVNHVAATVHSVLEACPGVSILATSREPLGVPGEMVHRLAPLALPAGAEALPTVEFTHLPVVTLFADRARLVSPDFTVTAENAAALARICRSVDGLPLAMELAAARIRTLRIDHLADRLGERLSMLASGPRTAPERQRTVEAAVRWSYDLLSEPEKTLFRRLAVFSGGWTLEAAEGICAVGHLAPADVLQLLDSLVDRSLVVASPGGDGRFRCLEVILEFARNELQTSGEAETMGARHCRWFRELTDLAEPHLEGLALRYWLDLLEVDHDNLRAALDWAATHEPSHADGLLISGNLAMFWNYRGHLREGFEITRRLLDAAPSSPPHARMAALHTLVWGAIAVLAHETAVTAAAEAARYARNSGDDRVLARSLSRGAYARLNLGHTADARTWAIEAVTVSRRCASLSDLARALFVLGMVESEQGDESASLARYEEGLAIAVGGEYPAIEGLFRISLGEAPRMHGDLDAAQGYYQRALEIGESSKTMQIVGLALTNLALTAVQRRNFISARSFIRAILLDGRLVFDGRELVIAGLCGAAVEAAIGDAARAAGWLAAFDDPAAFLVEAADRPVLRAALDACRNRLGGDFDNAYAAGVGMDPRTLPTVVLAVFESVPPPPPRAASPLAGLSPREVEILRLVAGGRSNQEIADALVLSRRTVETHIANAYAKIGAHGRVEATRFAIDHGLAPAATS